MKTKKLCSLLMALALCLSATAAYAAEYTVPGIYTVTYDDAFTLDDQSYVGDNTDGYTWFFLLTGDEYEFDADMVQLEGYESLTLYSATDDEKSAYLADTLDALSDYGATLFATVDAEANGTPIPFYVFQCANEEGPYLMAETVAQGFALDFYCYYLDGDRAVDEALLTALTDFIKSFKPVVAGGRSA